MFRFTLVILNIIVLELANRTNPAGVQCLESQLSSPSWKEMYNYLKGVFYLQSACELEVFLFAKILQVYS